MQNKGRAFSIVSAICFVAFGLFGVISDLIVLSYLSDGSYYMIYTVGYYIILIIMYLAMIAMGVFLFIGKKNIPLLVVNGILVLCCLIAMFLGFIFTTLIMFLAYAAAAFIIMLNVLECFKNKTALIKYTWFIPAALNAIVVIIYLVSGYMSFLSILFVLVEVAGFVFLGLWLNATVVIDTDTVNNVGTVNITAQNTETDSQIGVADELLKYKDLLDCGIITQEEFDSKKKELLGL